ncbi:MAG TPA: hypothetical protein VFQ40_01135 [Actinomycetota bacterium]|nr:hypothetical protein [Actinomycetota bacterium]
MSESDPITTSRGRLLAFRIVGWLLGLLAIPYPAFFAIVSIASDDPGDISHRFHFLAIVAGMGLIGVFSILWVTRPDRIGLFHALVSQAVAWLIGGLMGGDLITGLYVSGVIGLALLWILAPDRRALLRLPGRPSMPLLIFALIGTIPAWIYAVSQAELQRGPVDAHVEFHHWSGIAVAALSIAAAGIAASLRGKGWQVVATWTAIGAVLFGIAGLAFADLPGAPDAVGWSWIAVAAGAGFWLLARVEASREPAAR